MAKKDLDFYNTEDYYKVDAYISRDLFKHLSEQTPDKECLVNSIRLERVEDNIKIYYTWKCVAVVKILVT